MDISMDKVDENQIAKYFKIAKTLNILPWTNIVFYLMLKYNTKDKDSSTNHLSWWKCCKIHFAYLAVKVSSHWQIISKQNSKPET